MTGKQAENVTMSGGGAYSLATRGAKDVIDIATPRVLEAVNQLGLSPTSERFTMADMGCADGGTSLEMVRSVLGRVRERSPAVQSTVVYADQPGNDYNALVDILHGRTQFHSWFGEIGQAWPVFSGSSFYLQCVPDGTLDLAFSATAMHWLSTLPCRITGHVHMVGAAGPEAEAFSEQGRRDWETILMQRARELRPGGRMVLVNFCRDESGRYLGNTGGVNMFDTFNRIWQSFLADGRISEDEYHRMTLPQYYRTMEEFSHPLVDPDSACHRAGLRLDSIETRIVPCPFAEQFRQDGEVGAFADGLIPTVRTWNQSIFAAGLEPARPAEERSELIEDFYGEYHRLVLDDPRGHGMDYVHAYMTISRV